MAQATMVWLAIAWPAISATKRISEANKKEETRKVSKSVWFWMEPEAGKWPEICLPDARSVEEPAFGGLTICSSTLLKTE